MSDVATAATMNALNVERLQLRASVEALQALLEERRAYAERLLSENVRLTNEAATERERCGVLEREVKEWRECYQDYLCSGVWGNGGVMLQPKEVQATDTRHALDAAKFVGGGQ